MTAEYARKGWIWIILVWVSRCNSDKEIRLDSLKGEVQPSHVLHLKIHVLLYSNRAENIINFNTLQFASIELANRELEHLLEVNQRIYLKVDVDFFVSVLAVEQYDTTVDCA